MTQFAPAAPLGGRTRLPAHSTAERDGGRFSCTHSLSAVITGLVPVISLRDAVPS